MDQQKPATTGKKRPQGLRRSLKSADDSNSTNAAKKQKLDEHQETVNTTGKWLVETQQDGNDLADIYDDETGDERVVEVAIKSGDSEGGEGSSASSGDVMTDIRALFDNGMEKY
ncbi:hypothetical protein HK102_010252, partial [Quaeritorhiza haematococci]